MKTFNIHTDASAFQLGAVISYKVETIAFYGRELTHAQQRYKVTVKRNTEYIMKLNSFEYQDGN